MARKARIGLCGVASAKTYAAGALHHIMVRGIERRAVFRNDKDRDHFLERLGAILAETHTLCYAWALIPNHFHLLLKTGSVPLSTVMRRLLDRLCFVVQSKTQKIGPSVPEPLQIGFMPRGCLFIGVSALHSS